MNLKSLEAYMKYFKILIKVIAVFMSGITLFTSVIPGWFAKTYDGIDPATEAFSTVPVDNEPNAPRITIAANGASEYVIVRGAAACFAEQKAADELHTYLLKICGASIPVVTDTAAETSKEIIIGKTNRESTHTFTVNRTTLGDDGFTIKVADEKLIIAGGEKRGTLYGVYCFLEEYLGCRWYSRDFEIVPSIDRITVKLSVDDTQIPAFSFRDSYWYCAHDAEYRAKVKLNGIQSDSPVKPIGNYLDPIDQAGYSFDGIINGSKYFAEHPEYFFVDSTGKRNPGQLCLSNSTVIEMLTDYIRSDIKNHPTKELFTLFTNDSADYCLCDNCKAVNEAEGTCVGTLVRVVNIIAAEVYKIRPDATFRTLIWEGAVATPKITIPAKNVAYQLCAINCDMAKPYSEGSKRFCEFLSNWSKLNCQLSVWDYNINYTNYSAPYPNISYIDDNIKLMYENYVRGYFMLGNADGNSGEFGELRSYLVSKLLWDPYCDIEAIKEEFLRAYYGAGYKNIQAYINLTEKNAKDNFGIISDIKDILVLNEAQAAQCDAWWDAAEAAANGKEELARIQRSRISFRYYKSEMHLGEFSYLKSLWRRWDEGEKLYDDMVRLDVTYICQGRSLKDKDTLFFVQNANEWKR